MRLVKTLTIAVGVLMLTSCSSIRHTAAVANVDTNITNYTVADLATDGVKVQKTANWNFDPFNPVSVSTIKKNTEAQLLNEVGCDVLLDPQYVVERRGWLRGGTVTVIGIPAKYTNFHKLTLEEAEIIGKMKAGDCKEKHKKNKRFILF